MLGRRRRGKRIAVVVNESLSRGGNFGFAASEGPPVVAVEAKLDF
ncbi:hypothetical protein [Paenibacillus barengoltzii]|nr:hypothetical protein [Paenibacillus barengoltzii]